MHDLPSSVQLLFSKATRVASRDEVASGEPRGPASNVAMQLIERFGGLRVGAVGPGKECAASDVRFYPSLCPEDDAEALPWFGKVGQLAAFAGAHNEHEICLVSASGAFYVFTVPDGKLYELGATFGESMEKLLLGLSYGPAVATGA